MLSGRDVTSRTRDFRMRPLVPWPTSTGLGTYTAWSGWFTPGTCFLLRAWSLVRAGQRGPVCSVLVKSPGGESPMSSWRHCLPHAFAARSWGMKCPSVGLAGSGR